MYVSVHMTLPCKCPIYTLFLYTCSTGLNVIKCTVRKKNVLFFTFMFLYTTCTALKIQIDLSCAGEPILC